jgi:Nucleotide-diphospho-sugar transferase
MLPIICFLLLFSAHLVGADSAREKIRIYTIYTDSHEILYKEWFYPSLKNLHDDLELVALKVPQECVSGVYHQKGFQSAMMQKVVMIIRAIKETMGSWFIYSDVDIQFFEPIKEDLWQRLFDVDIAFQVDRPEGGVCAGFFACKSNERTLKLWSDVLALMHAHKNNEHMEDQVVLNIVLPGLGNAITWRVLPAELYLSGGNLTGKPWEPGKSLFVPRTVKIHHANWTKTMKNKIAQLKYVKSMVSSRKR